MVGKAASVVMNKPPKSPVQHAHHNPFRPGVKRFLLHGRILLPVQPESDWTYRLADCNTGMMGNMDTASDRKKRYVRAGPECRLALKKLVADFSVINVNQEDFVAASWLWMRTFDVEDLMVTLRPFIERARADGAESHPNGRQPSVGKPIGPKLRRTKSTG